MPTTEITTIALVAGSNGHDLQNKDTIALEQCLKTVISQQDLEALYCGTHVERPETLELMAVWTDNGAHEAWTPLQACCLWKECMGAQVAGEGSVYHVDFEPSDDFTKAVAAPVTEVATLFYDGTPPTDCMEGLREMRGVFQDHKISGWRALAGGLTHEEKNYEGVKGRAVVLAIGWDSVEQHLAWRATQLYADTIHLWPKGAKKLDMHHISFRKRS